jgi:hypothetical protein
MLSFIRLSLAIVATVCSASLFAADAPPASPPRYTFSWPLEGSGLVPRGGTTKGPAVTLDNGESPAWQRLQEKGISDFERDRRAILAMAGTYRVTFDFLEVTSFGANEGPKAPYQSWGTEKVYVDSDSGESISLVHILEMRIVQPDGKISEPMVTKHWRQDWSYQPRYIVEYKGNDRWERRQLASAESLRRWVQTVYQVDESPRYASLGHWEHTASFSTWVSGETYRPLPRREWSVRQDYQLLEGTNRHTILPTGWVQEENNLKAVLTPERELDASGPYVGREYGVARYQRIRDADFAAADAYYQRTKEFWDQVRDRWSTVFADRGTLTLKGPVDKLGLFQPLFAHADAIAEQGAAASKKNHEVIESALKEMGAVPGEENGGN